MDNERILLTKDDHMLIDLPEMIREKIFSYVKGPDMLVLTEVCQSWNSYITKLCWLIRIIGFTINRFLYR